MRFFNSFILLSCCVPYVLASLGIAIERGAAPRASGKTCVVKAGGVNTTDDAPAIRQAFEECGQGGTVAFGNTTYYVNTVMNITGLKDCEIDLKGTLLVMSFSAT